MNKRNRRPGQDSASSKRKLSVKKETIRVLSTLSDTDLQKAAGGCRMPSLGGAGDLPCAGRF